ncbi:MAG: L-asparaginase 2 [Bacteroidales bacterium]|nr:L-asparaginase 2 [Bacteroidales bacterium]
MKTLKALLLLLAVTASVLLEAKPKVRIIATGGTIAGISQSAASTVYKPGQVGIQTLIEAVPQILDLADISGEQLVNIGSQDMNDAVWLRLAKRINELLDDDDCDAVVVTHGTDTMEETAYFLNLTIKSDKPVILVGSMRPSNALSADGPANLYNAVATAISPQSRGMGVLCCMNNQLLDAKTVIKTHTLDSDTFKGGPSGILGYVHNGEAFYLQRPVNKHTVQTAFDVSDLEELPKVGIVYGYANASPLPLQAFVDAGFDGVVLAGVGDGNIYKDVFDAAVKAQKKGVQIVRSSRCSAGPTSLDGEVDDAKYHFVASLDLNPQKARVLLMLALTKTRDWKRIQQYFEEY